MKPFNCNYQTCCELVPKCQIEPQAKPVLTFEPDYTHQLDVGTPFFAALCYVSMHVCVCVHVPWWVFIHLTVVSVRILEAVMQTCMGKVCRGLLCICSWQHGVRLFFWGLLNRKPEFMDLQPAFNW